MRDINRDELQKALQSRKNFHLLDARGHSHFNRLHIKGARSVPADDAQRGVGLPDQLNAHIVFYCNGPEGKASTKAAGAAEKKGYTNVYRYKGGMTEWLQADLPVEGNRRHR